jgi:hypothetical protein
MAGIGISKNESDSISILDLEIQVKLYPHLNGSLRRARGRDLLVLPQ